MGLLDFFKKKNIYETGKTLFSGPEKRVTVFQGDLSKNIEHSYTASMDTTQAGCQNTSGDSVSANIFMTFEEPSTGWTCCECGARNAESNQTCEVCGNER